MPPADANQRRRPSPFVAIAASIWRVPAANRHRPRLGGIGRQAEAARQVVPGADRHDPDRGPRVRLQDSVDDLLDRAVATDDHEPIAAAGRGARRELLRLAGMARHVELDIGAQFQPLAEPRDQLRGAPGARGGVHDDHGRVRHRPIVRLASSRWRR